MPLFQALALAKSQGLDLVAVAPTSVPPVCRLMDYGRFKYEQAKKEREARKGQKTTLIRELRLRPNINDHDLEAKIRMITKLLAEGDKVKVSVFFRGREKAHPESGWKLLQRLVDLVKGKAAIERPPSNEERGMSLILSALPAAKKAKDNKELVTAGEKET